MNTPKPRVRSVTPVYNGEKYLAESIESVLSQTYENWEYAIVNNCSTDKTGCLLTKKEYDACSFYGSRITAGRTEFLFSSG